MAAAKKSKRGQADLDQPMYCRAPILLFNRDDAIRAHRCAERTANALILFLHISGRISLGVQLILCNCQALLGASVHTKSASLTQISVKCYLNHPYSSYSTTLRDAKMFFTAEDQNIFFVTSRGEREFPKAPRQRFFRRCAARSEVRLRG